VVTDILPVVAPDGTVATIWVALLTVNFAVVPLNLTAVAPVRLVPEIATVAPADPLVGESPVTVGAADVVTVRLAVEAAIPPGAITRVAIVAINDIGAKSL
jgi:hypothetical protein